ncbi:MAG: alpha-L-rhamnosidase [Ruminococcaceae bacterium]|nr:alpha-L-rhamnosidase [Oscillospiraceae bacterium]
MHEFKGSWITKKELSNIKPQNVFHRQLDTKEIEGKIPKNLHILFRNKFYVKNGNLVKVFISADDYYKLYINGKFVTQGPAPGFNFHYYYNEIDITDFVKEGENTIAVHTYYQGYINRVWVSGDDRCGLIYDVFENDKLILKSDENTKCAYHSAFSEMGHVGYLTQFLERYDSNSLEIGFEKEDYDDTNWEKCAINNNADYDMYLQPTKQLDIEKITPVSFTIKNNVAKIDFGSIYVGYLSLNAKGKINEKITVRCGQELNEDSSVRYELRANCKYEEEWILSGKKDTLNQFDYKSFRYVELLLPDKCEIDDIYLISRHYPFECNKTCKYDDEELLKIWNLCINSLKYGVQDIIQDCMEREKGQYLGDGCLSSTALSIVTNDTKMMEKMIDDALRTSFINEGLVTCSPCSFMQEIAEYPLMLPLAFLCHYKLTGNKEFIKERFDKLKSILDFYKNNYADESGMLKDLDKWCVVDWPKECRDGYDFELPNPGIAYGVHNVINAYYIGAIKIVNVLSKIIGYDDYADDDILQKRFIEVFYDENKKMFTDSSVSEHISLPANAFALMYNLCPDKETEENIVDMIMTKDASLSAFFTSFASLCALKRLNKDDLVKEFIKNKGRWLRMIREGATVTFEAWGKDGKWNTSLFHLCYTFAILFLTDWGFEDILKEI